MQAPEKLALAKENRAIRRHLCDAEV